MLIIANKDHYQAIRTFDLLKNWSSGKTRWWSSNVQTSPKISYAVAYFNFFADKISLYLKYGQIHTCVLWLLIQILSNLWKGMKYLPQYIFICSLILSRPSIIKVWNYALTEFCGFRDICFGGFFVTLSLIPANVLSVRYLYCTCS